MQDSGPAKRAVPGPPPKRPPLSEADRAHLLEVARAALATSLGLAPQTEEVREGRPVAKTSQAIAEPAGAFVTLRIGTQLRGCIGTFEPREPLVRVVAEMACAAASRDPRFSPLTAAELPLVRIGISVLSPRWPASPDELVVGKHGLYVAREERRGVLLPQVAAENGWNAEEFLAATCRKAGLPPEVARDPATTLHLFTAEVFTDPDL